MQEYRIVPVQGAPDWDTVPALPILHAQWLPDCGVSALAQLCYCESALYLRLSALEQHIRAEEQGPLGMPCLDSCLEFFFSPMDGDERYLNLEFSPSGCIFAGIGYGRADRTRLLLPEALALHPDIEFTAEGWQVTCVIPLALLRVFFPGCRFAPGQAMRANCYKCGDLTDHPHYLLWNPSTAGQPDFHRSCDFGIMYFV